MHAYQGICGPDLVWTEYQKYEEFGCWKVVSSIYLLIPYVLMEVSRRRSLDSAIIVHYTTDPVQVVSNPDIDSWITNTGTPLAPGHHTT